MKSELYAKLSGFVIVVLFVLFIYMLIKIIIIVDKRQVGTDDGYYTNRVKISKEIIAKAKDLTFKCQSELCEVSKVFNYVSNIQYKINKSIAHSPNETMNLEYGDCDDKSNLLISLLHSLDKEVYFVLVPEHIFVIVHLDDSRINQREGLWVNGKKYYILESTAKGSPIGFPLAYKLDEIDSIVEPFENKKIDIKSLEFRS